LYQSGDEFTNVTHFQHQKGQFQVHTC